MKTIGRNLIISAAAFGSLGLLALCITLTHPPAASAQAAPQAAKPPAAASSAPAASQIYDEKADGRQLVNAALARAKKENHNVLIQWGGNWCSWCIALHGLYEKDPDIKKVLSYEYELVMIDSAERNAALAKDLGAKIEGVPYLTILDANGKPLVQQETEALEVKDASGKSVGVSAGHDKAKVLAFLKAHVPTPWNADDVLTKGLAEAKATNRVAFVHFGAPWCGWCRRLEAWMDQPAIAAILARDYVDIKIDVDRTTNGQKMAESFGATGGIPWYAIVEPNGTPHGKSLITSGTADTNIGYPASDAEIDRFLALLKQTAPHATPADLDAIRASLQAAAKAIPAH